MKKYEYFVSFTCNKEFCSANGNAKIITNKKITNFEEISNIKEILEKENNIEKVTIINFILLRKI